MQAEGRVYQDQNEIAQFQLVTRLEESLCCLSGANYLSSFEAGATRISSLCSTHAFHRQCANSTSAQLQNVRKKNLIRLVYGDVLTQIEEPDELSEDSTILTQESFDLPFARSRFLHEFRTKKLISLGNIQTAGRIFKKKCSQ